MLRQTIMTDPEADAQEAANYITDVRYVAINPNRPMGYVSGAGIPAPENELQNEQISNFLDIVNDRGRRLH